MTNGESESREEPSTVTMVVLGLADSEMACRACRRAGLSNMHVNTLRLKLLRNQEMIDGQRKMQQQSDKALLRREWAR